jgi:hypothetical protein
MTVGTSFKTTDYIKERKSTKGAMLCDTGTTRSPAFNVKIVPCGELQLSTSECSRYKESSRTQVYDDTEPTAATWS